MLFILIGGTAEVGRSSRGYFTSQGFEVIKKKNCLLEGILTSVEVRNLATKQEVKACDFTYESGGFLVGFDKAQIVDACSGKKDCLLTMSADSLDFVWEIKYAYGDYVTVLGMYIDEAQLKRIIRENRSYSDRERKVRLGIGRVVHKKLLENREMFDEIIIYSAEDSVFNLEALHKQYECAIQRARKREREQNNRRFVELPYSGSESYIFISYAHKDRDRVYPILHLLQRNHCRVWYDRGIKGGENWRKLIDSKIESPSCAQIFLFISENSVASENVQNEIAWARQCGKQIVAIRLDDARLPFTDETYLEPVNQLYAGDEEYTTRILEAVNDSVRAHADQF